MDPGLAHRVIEEAFGILKSVRNEIHVDGGIKYIKIDGEEYAAQEVFDSAELMKSLDDIIETEKSVYDYVIDMDSNVERKFADDLNRDSDVKFFFKIPKNKCQIDTPFGPYTPDWAVLMDYDGMKKLYLLVNSTLGAFVQ